MPSFRLGTLGGPALGNAVLAVLEKVEQLRGSDTTALEKSVGLGILEVVVRPVVDESALEALWGLWSRKARDSLVQEKNVELMAGVWRGEELGRESIWAFSPP